MDKSFMDLKKLFNPDECIIDSFIFRLHYRFTLITLIAFSIAVTGRQYIGDPIDCISKDDIPNELLDTYCWIHTTFSVESAWFKEVGKEVPYPGVDKHTPGEKRVYHAYYQWVCFVLFLQAMLFFIPRYLWMNAESNKMKNLVMEFNSPVVSAEKIEDDSKDDEKKKEDDKKDGDKKKEDDKKDEDKKGDDEKDDEKKKDEEKKEDDEKKKDEHVKTDKPKEKKQKFKPNEKTQLLVSYLYENKGNHYFYANFYYVTQILNFVNVVGQIFLMDTFLGGEFTTYGTKVLAFSEWDYSLRYDPMIRVFPRMTKCTFHRYGSSGDVQKHDAMCLIPINILNEKIYIFLWFWFIILACLSGVELLYRAAGVAYVGCRRTLLRWRCSKVRKSDMNLVLEYLDKHDWLILYMLGKNITPCNFKIIMRDLAEKIRVTRQQNKKGSRQPGSESERQELLDDQSFAGKSGKELKSYYDDVTLPMKDKLK